MKSPNSSKIKSMQWSILKGMFLSTCLTIAILVLLMTAVGSTILDIGISPSLLEASKQLSTHIAIVLVVAVISTYLVGFTLTVDIKKQLLYINEVLISVTRGRIDRRLKTGSYSELNQISSHFNSMAEGIHHQVESLQRLVEENQRLLNNAEEAASLDERRKIARELHDSVSQQLFAISMTISAIKRLIDTDPTEAKKGFDSIEQMTHTAQQELRALIMHLRPVNLNGLPLSDGIIELLTELNQKNPNISIEWEIQPNVFVRPAGIEDHIFRVVQEAISNALRHSKASVLSLRLFVYDNLLSIFIEDNGIGFDIKIDKKSSYGILTMQERISEIGGKIDILSYPGKGTRIELRIPLKKKGGDGHGEGN